MLNWLNNILTIASKEGASDVHFSAGSPIIFRVDSDIISMNDEVISNEQLSHLKDELIPNRNPNEDHDIAYEIPGVSRFRMNIYNQRKGISISVRIIPLEIKEFKFLQLPSELMAITKKKNGIFLVTGPTGSGKSTTLASMIQLINTRDRKRVITLEDPIEFIFENKNSVIEQREVGKDVKSFQSGIRSSLRQDPDVLMVGELRDLDTISTAITAAETGHLVLATLHTTDAPKTVDRIIDAFPPEQQKQVRNQIASLLLGVLSQRLVKKPSGKGRQIVTELMINNKAIANTIRNEKIHQIHNIMQTASAEGMHTLEQRVSELVREGMIITNHGLIDKKFED